MKIKHSINDYIKTISLPLGAVILVFCISDIVPDFQFLCSRTTAPGFITKIETFEEEVEENNGRKISIHNVTYLSYKFWTEENAFITGGQKVYIEIPKDLIDDYNRQNVINIEYAKLNPKVNYIKGYDLTSGSFLEWLKKYGFLLTVSIGLSWLIGYEIFIKKATY